MNKRSLDTLYRDTIYYVAELDHLAMSDQGDISFALKSYKISNRPLKISTDGFVQTAGTKDGSSLFPAAPYSYRFFGQWQNDKITVQRVANMYGSRADKFIFTKRKED